MPLTRRKEEEYTNNKERPPVMRELQKEEIWTEIGALDGYKKLRKKLKKRGKQMWNDGSYKILLTKSIDLITH